MEVNPSGSVGIAAIMDWAILFYCVAMAAYMGYSMIIIYSSQIYNFSNNIRVSASISMFIALACVIAFIQLVLIKLCLT